MKRSAFLTLFGAAVLTTTLSACTSFAPVYGDASADGLANARFNFAAPTNRTEQIILNRLQTAFPNPAGPSDPTLKVVAGTSGTSGALSDVFPVGRPVNIRVDATVSIVTAGEVVFTAKRFTDTSYQSGKLTINDISSSTGASETAARSTAESIRAAILAGYRPGMAPPR